MTPWLAKIVSCITIDHSDIHSDTWWWWWSSLSITLITDKHHTFRYLIMVMIVKVRTPLYALSSKPGWTEFRNQARHPSPTWLCGVSRQSRNGWNGWQMMTVSLQVPRWQSSLWPDSIIHQSVVSSTPNLNMERRNSRIQTEDDLPNLVQGLHQI